MKALKLLIKVGILPVMVAILSSSSMNQLLAQCPTFSDIEIPNVCDNQPFDSLFVVTTADSVEIVAYPFAPLINPYTTPGGTSLGLLEVPANDTLLAQPFPHSLAPGFYLFFAKVHPEPTDPLCRPFDSKAAEVVEYIDYSTGDGQACMNSRINLNDYLTGGITAGNEVKFYNSLTDAQNAENSIPDYDYPSTTTKYYVVVKASGSVTIPDNCVKLDSFEINVLAPPSINAGPDQTECGNESVQLAASGALSYSWFPTTYLSNPNLPNPTLTIPPNVTISYSVTGTDANDCTADDQVIITGTPSSICPGITARQD